MDNNAKLRPLYLAKILYERTDEGHYLTTMQLAQILEEEYGIPAHRQTIKTDIELLQQFGMDIQEVKSTQNRYNLISRQFEIAELKLLIDAVQSSHRYQLVVTGRPCTSSVSCMSTSLLYYLSTDRRLGRLLGDG